MTGLMWLGIALIGASVLVVWSALVLGSKCDDVQEQLRWEAQRDAIARAAEKARTRP